MQASNLGSLAMILWSGMLIISGSIWVLSSQVRRLVELLEDRSMDGSPEASTSTYSPAGLRPADGRAGVPVPIVHASRAHVA